MEQLRRFCVFKNEHFIFCPGARVGPNSEEILFESNYKRKLNQTKFKYF